MLHALNSEAMLLALTCDCDTKGNEETDGSSDAINQQINVKIEINIRRHWAIVQYLRWAADLLFLWPQLFPALTQIPTGKPTASVFYTIRNIAGQISTAVYNNIIQIYNCFLAL